MIEDVLDEISRATERGLARELTVEARSEKPLSKYPYSALPPFFPEREERENESDRVVFSVQTWDGRNVMSLQTKD